MQSRKTKTDRNLCDKNRQKLKTCIQLITPNPTTFLLRHEITRDFIAAKKFLKKCTN